MFVEELDKHLATATEILALLAPGAALTGAQRIKLSQAFHTIRGGAGFFELVDIGQIAKTLEELLHEPSLNPSSPKPGGTGITGLTENDSEHVRGLVQRLLQIASCLPR